MWCRRQFVELDAVDRVLGEHRGRGRGDGTNQIELGAGGEFLGDGDLGPAFAAQLAHSVLQRPGTV